MAEWHDAKDCIEGKGISRGSTPFVSVALAACTKLSAIRGRWGEASRRTAEGEKGGYRKGAWAVRRRRTDLARAWQGFGTDSKQTYLIPSTCPSSEGERRGSRNQGPCGIRKFRQAARTVMGRALDASMLPMEAPDSSPKLCAQRFVLAEPSPLSSTVVSLDSPQPPCMGMTFQTPLTGSETIVAQETDTILKI